jgi:glycerate dehydrogenase
MNNIVLLDSKTLGDDIDLTIFEEFGDFKSYETTSLDKRLDNIGKANIVITNKVIIDKEIMDNSSIELICIAATGMNNVDLEYAKEKGITVKNVAGYSTASVTQLTFALILELINRIPYYDNFVKSKEWLNYDTFTHLGNPWNELSGKKFGIIGFGAIGQGVAKVAESFGCEVSYYSTSGLNNNAYYYSYNLVDMLSNCDIISIHAPLNEKTNNLINSSNLHLLKENAILLNLGRGGIINETDVVAEVESRNIYYATDVIEKEPMQDDSPFLNITKKDNYLFTPHIAWASYESRKRLVSLIKENIKTYLL